MEIYKQKYNKNSGIQPSIKPKQHNKAKFFHSYESISTPRKKPG